MKFPVVVFLAVLGCVPVFSLEAADAAKKKVLIVETTTGYRHASIATGEKVLQKLADESGTFEIAGIVRQPDVPVLQKPNAPKKPDTTADDKTQAKYETDLKSYQDKLAAYDPLQAKELADQFNAQLTANLAVLSPEALNAKGIDGVIFDSTTGNLPLPDKQGFIDWVKAGHAFIGVHSATDTFHEFKPYIDMIGGEFDGHPWTQTVTVKVEDPAQPAAGGYRDKFEIQDEIYQFKNWNRSGVHVVLSLDASNADRSKAGAPAKGFFERGKRPDDDYALSWVRDFGTGRVFYTALGHREEVWNDPMYQQHLLGGIKWVLGLVAGDAMPK